MKKEVTYFLDKVLNCSRIYHQALYPDIYCRFHHNHGTHIWRTLILMIGLNSTYFRNQYLFLKPPSHVGEHDPHDPTDHFGHSCELHFSVRYGFKLESHRQSDTLEPFSSQRCSLVRWPCPQVAVQLDQPSLTQMNFNCDGHACRLQASSSSGLNWLQCRVSMLCPL